MSQHRPDAVARFWAKVDKGSSNECWLWRGGKRGKYGLALDRKQRVAAHRLAYQLTHGPIPAGMCVCHSCDTCLCVNPAHLWLGTHQENLKDMTRKGRHSGVTTGRLPQKLTPNEVDHIRQLLGQHIPQRTIALQFGVSQPMISHINKNINWTEETYLRINAEEKR